MKRTHLRSSFDLTEDEFNKQLASTKKTMKRAGMFGGFFMIGMVGISIVSSCALIYLLYAAAQWLQANQ